MEPALSVIRVEEQQGVLKLHLCLMAGGPGFEPELPGPEPGVLPLNYPPRDLLASTILL